MTSAPSTMPSSSAVEAGFAELERQQELITSCTALWKELSDHFSSIERCLELRSESLCSKRRTLDVSTQRKLASLHRREESIDGSVDLAITRVEEIRAASLFALSSADAADLPARLRVLCKKMDSDAFFDLIVSSRKESDLLRKEIPLALKESIDPATFVMDAIARVFPVDRRAVKSPPGDLGWVCVLLLESLVSALADPELGAERLLVTRIVKERAKEMADAWKDEMEQRGVDFHVLYDGGLSKFSQGNICLIFCAHCITLHHHLGLAAATDQHYWACSSFCTRVWGSDGRLVLPHMVLHDQVPAVELPRL